MPTSLGIAIGGLGTGLFHGINLAATYGAVAKLRRRQGRGRANRASGSSADLERDFMATDQPVAHFISALPMLIGAVYAIVPAFTKSYEASQRIASATMGCVGLLIGHQLAFRPNFTTRYLLTLSELGLELQAGPREHRALRLFLTTAQLKSSEGSCHVQVEQAAEHGTALRARS